MSIVRIVLESLRVPALGLLALGLAAAAAPAPAGAAIVGVSGNGQILDPSVTPTAATPSFFNSPGLLPPAFGWDEKQNVVLDRDIYVDIVSDGTYNSNGDLGGFHDPAYKIAEGTAVSSHLLYFDPARLRLAGDVTFTFSHKILGVIVESDRFYRRANDYTDYFVDSDFLGNPLTVYPTGHFANRGLEMGLPDTVSVDVSDRTLKLDLLGAIYPGDQIRVITAVPEPASLVSGGVAALALSGGLLARRRRPAA